MEPRRNPDSINATQPVAAAYPDFTAGPFSFATYCAVGFYGWKQMTAIKNEEPEEPLQRAQRAYLGGLSFEVV